MSRHDPEDRHARTYWQDGARWIAEQRDAEPGPERRSRSPNSRSKLPELPRLRSLDHFKEAWLGFLKTAPA
jgi:hypothetical protein